MIAEANLIDKLFYDIQKLSPEYRIRLIQRISESLLSTPKESAFIQYGKYRSHKESKLDDFAVVEWNPEDDIV